MLSQPDLLRSVACSAGSPRRTCTLLRRVERTKRISSFGAHSRRNAGRCCLLAGLSSVENSAEFLRISCEDAGQCVSRHAGECGSRKRGNLGHKSGGMWVTEPAPYVLVQEKQDRQEKKSRTVEAPALGGELWVSLSASAPAVPKSPPPRSQVGRHLPALAHPAATARRIARCPLCHQASPRPAGYGVNARTPASCTDTKRSSFANPSSPTNSLSTSRRWS